MSSENRHWRSRFPALVAIAAFFSNLRLRRPKIRNPFKKRSHRGEEEIPASSRPVHSDSIECLSSGCFPCSGRGGKLLSRLKDTLQGLRPGRVIPNAKDGTDLETQVQELSLYSSSSKTAFQFEDEVYDGNVLHQKVVGRLGDETEWVPTIRATDSSVQVGTPVISWFGEQDGSAEPPLAVRISEKIGKEFETELEKATEITPTTTYTSGAYGVERPFDQVESWQSCLSRVVPTPVLSAEKYYTQSISEGEKTTLVDHASREIQTFITDTDNVVRLSAGAFHSSFSKDTHDLGTDEDQVSTFTALETPSELSLLTPHAKKPAQFSVGTDNQATPTENRESEDESKEIQKEEKTSVENFHVQISGSAAFLPVSAAAAVSGDLVLEDVETFEKEMAKTAIRSRVKTLRSSNRIILQGSSQDEKGSSTVYSALKSSGDLEKEEASQKLALKPSLETPDVQSETTAVEHTSDELAHSSTIKASAKREESSETTNSNGLNQLSVDFASLSPAQRRCIKLKYVLGELPSSEEYLYHAIIADEEREILRAQELQAQDAQSAQDRQSQATFACQLEMAYKLREVTERMAKKIENQALRNVQDESGARKGHDKKARALKNEYGYPAPNELSPNPPEIMTYSARRYRKFQERLIEVKYPHCTTENEHWADTFITGKQVHYARYNDSEQIIRIGHGSYGEVFLGLHDDNLVVIKLFKHAKSNLDDVAKEATVTKYLSQTGCSPRLYGLVVLPDNDTFLRLGLVLEQIGDYNLNSKKSRFFEVLQEEIRNLRNDRRTLVPRKDWLRICYKLADGLARIHEQRIIINDLKMDNLLLKYDGRHYKAYMIDFGIARSVYDDEYKFYVEEDKRDEFSEHYTHVAPEIYTGSHATYKSDIYSIGSILLTIDGIFNFNIRHIASLCRQADPEKRPTASELALMLRTAFRSRH